MGGEGKSRQSDRIRRVGFLRRGEDLGRNKGTTESTPHKQTQKKTPDQHKGKGDEGNGGEIGTKEGRKEGSEREGERTEKREKRERRERKTETAGGRENGADGATPADPPRTREPHADETLGFGLWTLDFGLWTLDFGLWVCC